MFIDRLQKVMFHYQLTASAFADSIGVPRSSISHLLSGRNKPSLDFILKLIKTYPEVDLYWILNGKGSFPSTPKKEDVVEMGDKKARPVLNEIKDGNQPNKDISKVVIFYSDGTFEAFEPKK